jgi:hypothetical protein
MKGDVLSLNSLRRIKAKRIKHIPLRKGVFDSKINIGRKFKVGDRLYQKHIGCVWEVIGQSYWGDDYILRLLSKSRYTQFLYTYSDYENNDRRFCDAFTEEDIVKLMELIV